MWLGWRLVGAAGLVLLPDLVPASAPDAVPLLCPAVPAGRVVPAEICAEVGGAEEAAAPAAIAATADAGELGMLPIADWTAERSMLPRFCMTGDRSIGVPLPTCRVIGLLSPPCKPMYNSAPSTGDIPDCAGRIIAYFIRELAENK